MPLASLPFLLALLAAILHVDAWAVSHSGFSGTLLGAFGPRQQIAPDELAVQVWLGKSRRQPWLYA
jgi:hypothetical protein